MKKIVLMAIAAFCFGAVSAQTSQAKDITKILEFRNDTYDFGKIPFGKPVEYNVTIKNISNDSVWIDNIKVGCGCTTPKYEPGKKFGPGQEMIVTLGFNGSTMGIFNKYADIYFNNNSFNKQVTFKGETFTDSQPAQPSTNVPAGAVKSRTN